MSDFDIDFGVRISNLEQAIRDLGRVQQANQRTADTTRRAARDTSEAAQQAGRAVQQLGQRAGQSVGAIGAMATSLSQVTGLSTSASSAISQVGGAVGALSGAMGPLGVALGAVTLAVTAFNTALNYETTRNREAVQAAHDHAEQLRSLATAARQARQELSLQRDIAESIGSVGGDQLQQQAEERRQRVLELERTRSERLAGLGLVERNGQVFRRNAFGEMAASLPAGFESGAGSQAEIQRLREEVTSIERELVRREEQAAGDQRAAQQASIESANQAEKERELANREAGRRRSSGGRSALDENLAGYYQRLEQMDRQIRDEERSFAESRRWLEDREKEHGQRMVALREEQFDQTKHAEEQRDQERRRAQEEAMREQERLFRQMDEKIVAFQESYHSSLDDVVKAWREANEAMERAGEVGMANIELMRVGMVAAGNEIADTIGGTMTSAFEQALGAWLDGSKSFVEAAEDMVKGVLKALVIESIVQAVTETARGIADLASYHYDTAALHFAAAAAWGAVGGVAGAVGAGIGAFGGGKDSGSAATSSVTPSDSASTAQPQQSIVIYVMPGGYITRRDVYAGIVDALNDAGREGYRLDPGVIGG